MKHKNILIKKESGICYITINRPKQLNALNIATIKELSGEIIEAEKDRDIKCILLTGSGDKSFVAGADIKEFVEFNVSQGEKLAKKGQETLFDLLENLTTPSIAAINGFALGGGLELAMACHIRIASEDAKLGLPEVSLGVIPGYGGTQRLASLVGKGRAIEIITTAQMFSSKEALDWGLVTHVCSGKSLISMAEKIASKIKRNSPSAIAKAINSINAGYKDGVNGFEVEISEFGACFKTAEFIEGTTAFMEKRKANF